MKDFLRSLSKADSTLAATGWLILITGVICLGIAPWDDRLVTGVNPWYKPVKFCLSTTIFLWSLALMLRPLPVSDRMRHFFSRGFSALMLIEIASIVMQAARGEQSHFNSKSEFGAAVFALMGLAILANTILVFFLLVQYLWQPVELPRATLMGIRLGMIVFIIGSLEGMVMIINMGHTFGAPDGGPGLPFLNWSTKYGDLRIAHMIAIHGLQILPLAGYALSRWMGERKMVLQLIVVTAVALGVCGAFLAMLRLAVSATPLIRL